MTTTTGAGHGPVVVGYTSDIHTEFMRDARKVRRTLGMAHGRHRRPDNATVMVLAGDVGAPACSAHLETYRAALEFFSELYERVVVITGNHEYYFWPTRAERRRAAKVAAMSGEAGGLLTSSSSSVLAALVHPGAIVGRQPRQTAAHPTAAEWVAHVDGIVAAECERASGRGHGAVTFLQAGAAVPLTPDGSLRVTGATLWTDVRGHNEPIAAREVTDFAGGIPFGFGPGDSRRIHQAHLRGIAESLDACSAAGARALVVTHHVPRRDLIVPAHERVPCVYSSRCEVEAAVDDAYACAGSLPGVASGPVHPAVCAWVHGHAHGRAVDDTHDGVRFVRDPMGYPGEDGSRAPLPTRTLELVC